MREIYEYLDKKLIDNQRSTWVAEELEILTSEDTYKVDPSGMWKRIKIKSTSGKVLAILRERGGVCRCHMHSNLLANSIV